jgi:hypothetical protein
MAHPQSARVKSINFVRASPAANCLRSLLDRRQDVLHHGTAEKLSFISATSSSVMLPDYRRDLEGATLGRRARGGLPKDPPNLELVVSENHVFLTAASAKTFKDNLGRSGIGGERFLARVRSIVKCHRLELVIAGPTMPEIGDAARTAFSPIR